MLENTRLISVCVIGEGRLCGGVGGGGGFPEHSCHPSPPFGDKGGGLVCGREGAEREISHGKD